MLKILARAHPQTAAKVSLTLSFDERQKSRLRTRLDDGTEAGLILERGRVLRDGDCLLAENGQVIQVRAALEQVSTVTCADATGLARAAYHLGNRHVALQIGTGWLRYRQDHVLDAMVCALGLQVQHEQAPFEPEVGAYHAAHHHPHE